jgi:hypothetical protein
LRKSPGDWRAMGMGVAKTLGGVGARQWKKPSEDRVGGGRETAQVQRRPGSPSRKLRFLCNYCRGLYKDKLS